MAKERKKKIVGIIESFLEEYKSGAIDKSEVVERIKDLYFEDIGYAKVDHHRQLRKDFPEVIYGKNKSNKQIIEISKKMLQYSDRLMITKTDREVFEHIKKEIKGLKFNESANVIYRTPDIADDKLMNGVTIVCAGTSDIAVAEEASIVCELMKNRVKKIYDIGVAGIHRLFDFLEILKESNVVIVIAGMEGALPGIVTALVNCPVIGVPTSTGYGTNLNGLSPLLTMLNSCSPGLMCVNVDNGFGAGFSAGLINRKIQDISQ